MFNTLTQRVKARRRRCSLDLPGAARSLTHYEAVAFPSGSPAILKVAQRLGAAPSPRSFGDSTTQAGARCVDESGALSRTCTGIA